MVSTGRQPEGRPPGTSTGVPSLYRHLMSLNPQPLLLGFHSMSAWCYYLMTRFVGILMGMGWPKSQSHHQSSYGGFRPKPWSAKAHSSTWPPKSRPLPDFDVVLLLWFELLQSSLPSASSISSRFLQCHCVRFASRSSGNHSHSPYTLYIRFQAIISMPRLRGKSKRGAAWYATKERAA